MLRRILACIAIGVVAAIIALLSHSARWLERLEFITWDARQRWLAEPAPDEIPIKLILIDQPSLDWAREQAGTPWPWPREFYTAIIDFCNAGGAKAIGFDLFFSEPSMFGQDDDDRFAASLANGSATVLAVPPGPQLSTPATWPDDVPRPEFAVPGFDAWRGQHADADLSLNSVIMSLPEIASAATALAHVRGDQDSDSIIRRIAPVVFFDGQSLPVLGLAMYDVASEDSAAMRVNSDTLLVDAHHIPLDDSGEAVLRFRRPTLRGEQRRMYEAFSAAGVINAQIARMSDEAPMLEPSVFKDCYVIIGASAAGTYDLKPTPMNPAGPGAEVHATFLDNLLSDTFMRMPNERSVWLFTIVLAILGAAATRLSRNGVYVVLAFLCALPMPWVFAIGAFEKGLWWPIVVPEFAVAMALVGGLIANYAFEGRQRRFIKRTFQHYLSPAVIDQIVQEPSRLRLGGERRELTIFFSDLVGFSGIAEKLDAQALAAMLNDYLTEMTNIILEEDGTVDKYIGDAIVAFWNAPLTQPDHAQRAMRAAVKCQRALAARREEFRDRVGAGPSMRIGINTGIASVGNFGSEGRFDYTIIGHAVNLASRLEGASKFFGTTTIIAHDTWQHAQDLMGREIGLVRVVGIERPVRVFEPLIDNAIDEAQLQAWHDALALCQTGKHAEARLAFEKLPESSLVKLYCEKLRSDSTWDGVWNLTDK